MNDDFPILAAIAATPAHPYRVLDHLQALGVKATRSTLYRRIEALTAAGLLCATLERGETGHTHRQLGLTPAGLERVAQEAAALLRDEPLESPFVSLAVACAEAAGSDALLGVLRGRMAAAARRLTDEERSLRTAAGEDYWSRASRERRIAHLQTDVKWLQSVMRERLVARSADSSMLSRAG